MAEYLDRTLCVIDGTYMMYYTIFSAQRKFESLYPDDARILFPDPETVDQENLPCPTVSQQYLRVLKETFIDKCNGIESVLRNNFQDILDDSEVDFIFALDSGLKHSFRKEKFPEYKAQRKLIKRSYNVFAVKDYIEKVLFPDLDIHGIYGYNLVRVDGAEADDVIACVMMGFTNYRTRILFASDHDFCQLEGVRQFDLSGKEVIPTITRSKGKITLTPKEAKMVKILSGDSSDNIPAVKNGIGKVRAYDLIHNKDKLKEFLVKNQDAAKQYILNRTLVDFNMIPDDLRRTVVESVGKYLDKSQYEKTALRNALEGQPVMMI